MACFVAPMIEAIVITVVKKVIEKKESKDKVKETTRTRLTWSRKLSWLNKLLWGGVSLLALEHLWHGEIVLWPPFLTALNNSNDVSPMLREIATIGTAMAIFVTFVWGIMVLIADQRAKAIPDKIRVKV